MRSAHGTLSKRRVVPVMVLALVVGLLVPFVIRGLESDLYRMILGIMLLLMIPIMVIKKVGIKPHHPSLWQKYVGGGHLGGKLAVRKGNQFVMNIMIGLMAVSALALIFGVKS
jgi:hypothetical protein